MWAPRLYGQDSQQTNYATGFDPDRKEEERIMFDKNIGKVKHIYVFCLQLS